MTAPLTVTVDLYELDHVAARFRAADLHTEANPAIDAGIVRHARIGIDLPTRDWTALGRPGTLTLTIAHASASAAQQYNVGDPDPTPWDLPESYRCGATYGIGYAGGALHSCNLDKQHRGRHVAGNGEIIVETWGS